MLFLKPRILKSSNRNRVTPCHVDCTLAGSSHIGLVFISKFFDLLTITPQRLVEGFTVILLCDQS